MENLKSLKFKANRWDNSSIEVEGSLNILDYKTIEPADLERNPNGYLITINNESGVHIIQPDSIQLIDKCCQKFGLNAKEKETVKELIKASEILYDIDQLARSYTFSPSGIGNKVEVSLRGYKDKNKIFEILKDITDYDSW